VIRKVEPGFAWPTPTQIVIALPVSGTVATLGGVVVIRASDRRAMESRVARSADRVRANEIERHPTS
jgi:hypothetical protein